MAFFFFFFFGFSASSKDLELFFGLLVDLDIGLLAGCKAVLDIDTPRSVSAAVVAADVDSWAPVVEARSSLAGSSFDIEEWITARTASSATPSGACWLSAASCENVLWSVSLCECEDRYGYVHICLWCEGMDMTRVEEYLFVFGA